MAAECANPKADGPIFLLFLPRGPLRQIPKPRIGERIGSSRIGGNHGNNCIGGQGGGDFVRGCFGNHFVGGQGRSSPAGENLKLREVCFGGQQQTTDAGVLLGVGFFRVLDREDASLGFELANLVLGSHQTASQLVSLLGENRICGTDGPMDVLVALKIGFEKLSK